MPPKLAGLTAIIGTVAEIRFGAPQAGRNVESVERMRGTIEVQQNRLERNDIRFDSLSF